MQWTPLLCVLLYVTASQALELTCDAGGPYDVQCVNNQARIILNGASSRRAVKYEWSADESYVSLSNADTSSPQLSFTEFCSKSIQVHLTVWDAEGQSSTCQAQVSMDDTTKPQLLGLYTESETISVECGDVPVALNGIAKDDCDASVSVVQDEVKVAGSGKTMFTLHRSWTATDNCGNVNTHTQTINVQDTEAPEIVGVEEDTMTVQCFEPEPCIVTAIDHCDDDVSVKIIESKNSGSCPHSYTVKRTWTVHDDQQNTASASQVILVRDNDAPTLIGVPDDVSVECDSIPIAPDVTASDDCDKELSVVLRERIPTDECDYVMTRTWSVTDACHNEAIKEQRINVTDSKPPVLSGVQDDRTVPCDAVPDPCVVTVSDNCDDSVTVQHDFVSFDHPTKPCDNNKVLVHTWTAQDSCGNLATETQTLTVEDTSAPKFSGLPPERLTAVECDAIPKFPLEAEDNCDASATVIVVETFVVNGVEHETKPQGVSQYDIVRVYTTTDSCGNKAEFTQTIEVVDTIKPWLDGLPPKEITVSCENIPPVPEVDLIDNCPCGQEIISETQDEEAGTCEYEYTIFRTWEATDCGNNHVVTQRTIHVVDTQNPRFVGDLPEDGFASYGNVPEREQLTATDNCGDATVTFDQQPIAGSCEHAFDLVRTWTATDSCGNTAQHQVTIEVMDDSPPVLDQVPNLTYNCIHDSTVPNVAATDDSGDVYDPQYDFSVFDKLCDHEYKISRVWEVVDDCGNRASTSQTLTVVDNVAPQPKLSVEDLLNLIPNITVEESGVPGAPDILFMDECLGEVKGKLDETPIPSSCDTEYLLVRTWTASDDCGNDATPLRQTITVVDVTPPSIHGLADATYECLSAYDDPVGENGVDFSKFGDDIYALDQDGTKYEVRYVSTEWNNNACTDQNERVHRFTARDCAGNTVEGDQTITITNTLPIVHTLPTLDLECGEDPPVITSLNVTGSCADPLQFGAPTWQVDGETRIRTWTAADNCVSDAAVVTQTIKFSDTTPPVFSNLPNETLRATCSEPPAPDVEATDSCSSSVSVDVLESKFPGSCDSRYTFRRKWTAADDDGNTASHQQVIYVSDTIGPDFDVGDALLEETVQCPDDVPSKPTVNATDNCGGKVTLTSSEMNLHPELEEGEVTYYGVQRTWEALDHCGNRGTWSNTVWVKDTLAPTFNDSPVSKSVNCHNVPDAETLTASDNCQVVTVVLDETRVDGTCSNAYTLYRTWTATDKVGNTNSVTSTITVVDTVAPEFDDAVFPVTASSTDGSAPDFVAPSATDNCDSVTPVCETSRADGACPTEFVLTHICTVSDACGNQDNFKQTVTVTDSTKPVLTVTGPDEVECNDYNASTHDPAFTVSPADSSVITESVSVNMECPHTHVKRFTFTATHPCGEVASTSHDLKIQDTTPPDITPEEDRTYECQELPVDYIIDPDVADNCDGDSVLPVFSEERLDGNDGSFDIILTWTATDTCGNKATEYETIHVYDATPPTIADVPASTSSEYPTVPTAPNLTASDNCDDVTPVASEEKEDGDCEYHYKLIRTWTAADRSGNADVQVYTVQIQDTVPPEFVTTPLDTTVSFSDDMIPVPELTATDSSGHAVTPKYEGQVKETTDNDHSYSLTRTWSVEDACGNTATTQQIITVVDDVPPVLWVPPNMTLQCNELAEIMTDEAVQDQIKAIANETLTIQYSEVRTDGSCLNAYDLVRTWSATDAGGNVESVSQLITVRDTTKPYWTTDPLPENPTLFPCTIPDAPVLEAEDACSVDQEGGVSISVVATVESSDICDDCSLRTWVATDACGNSIEYFQLVSAHDDVDPTFVDPDNLPVDESVACEYTPADTLNGEDNCLEDVTVTLDEDVPHTCASEYLVIRTWTATDWRGNTAKHIQTVTVFDRDDPVLDAAPGDTTVQCDDDVADPVDLNSTDNCDGDKVVTWTQSPIEDGFFREWSRVDACGNDASTNQTIIIKDTTAPVISADADATVDCTFDPASAKASATDNCGGDVSLVMDYDTFNKTCDYDYTLVLTWTATDESGNSVDGHQTVVVEDNDAPALERPLQGENMIVECSAIPDQESLSALDTCEGDITVVPSQTTIIQSNDPNTFTFLNIWTATDSCSNSEQTVQTVSVIDSTPPVLGTIPGDSTHLCSDIPVAVSVTATDNCQGETEVDVTMAESTIPGSCTTSYKLVRTWTATDLSGNTNFGSQTLSIYDDEKPSFKEELPENSHFECQLDEPAILTADDTCEGVVSVVYDSTPDESGDGTEYRSWTAIDDCGNQARHTQTVTLSDDTDPTWTTDVTEYDDTTQPCGNVPEGSTPEANDNCDGALQGTWKDQTIDHACDDGYTLIRTFTVSDSSGNTLTHQTTLFITDDVDPEIQNVPGDVTVDCGNIPSMPNLTFNDNCAPDGDATSSFSLEGDNTIIRTWTAADRCGNSAEAKQTITLTDTTDPTLVVPDDETIYCPNAPSDPSSLLPDDDCSTMDWVDGEVKGPFVDGCAQQYWVEHVWSATDDSGNEVTMTQTIKVEDNEKPLLAWACQGTWLEECETEYKEQVGAGRPLSYSDDRVCCIPKTLTPPSTGPTDYSCDDVPNKPDTVVDDLCDTTVSEEYTEKKFGDDDETPNDYLIVRTWTAEDDCGNAQDLVQSLQISDSKKPDFSIDPPEDAAVDCTDIPEEPTVTAKDTCDLSVSVEYDEQRNDGSCPSEYTLVRTWSVTDTSGNDNSMQQTITVTDVNSPTFVPAAIDDVTLNCVINEVPDVEGSDLCDDYISIVTDEKELERTNEFNYVLLRTWEAQDDCGNQDSITQTVTVQDIEDPTITGVPADTEVEYPSVPSAHPNVAATDNCEELTPVFSEEKLDGDCAFTYELVRTWTATDSSQNFDVQTQTISVADTTPPVLHNVPSDNTYEYGEVPQFNQGLVTATDNSGEQLVVDITDTKIPTDSNHSFTIVRTFSAEDDCGNTAAHVQQIVVVDTTPPTLTDEPRNETIECDSIPPPCVVHAVEEPEEDIDVSFHQTGKAKIIRTWMATDAVGNVVTHTQTIDVVDTTPPVLSRHPESVTVSCNCDTFPAPAAVFALDNCDESIEAPIFTETRIDGDSANDYQLIRRWVATDNAGNQQVWEQTVTVEDTETPVLQMEPEDTDAQCHNNPDSYPVNKVRDNCDDSVSIERKQSKIPSSTCDQQYTLHNTWFATDVSGNQVSHTQTVSVLDTDAPQLEPYDVMCLEASDDLPFLALSDAPSLFAATDNCAQKISVTLMHCNFTQVNQVSPSDDCTNGNANFPCECQYNTATDGIYLDADNLHVGRTYDLVARIEDECGNADVVKRSFRVVNTGGLSLCPSVAPSNTNRYQSVTWESSS